MGSGEWCRYGEVGRLLLSVLVKAMMKHSFRWCMIGPCRWQGVMDEPTSCELLHHFL